MKARYLLILLSMMVSSAHAQRIVPARYLLKGGPESILKSKDPSATALGIGDGRYPEARKSFFTGSWNPGQDKDLSPQIPAERVSAGNDLSAVSSAIEPRENLLEWKLSGLRERIRRCEEAGHYAEALVYQKQYDSLRYFMAGSRQLEEWVQLQNLDEAARELQQNKTEAAFHKKERTVNILLLAVIALLPVSVLLLYRQQKIRSRKDRTIRGSREAFIEAQLNDARSHEAQLQDEIEKKNRELSAYILHSIQKNQLLEDLKNTIRRIREDAGGNASSELGKMVHKISNSINLDENWNAFSLYFEQAHHRFFQQLKTQFGELTSKELRLCALLKLNLSSKEMAAILGISTESVKMARYRMRKKLHLHSHTDLGSFMLDFERRLT